MSPTIVLSGVWDVRLARTVCSFRPALALFDLKLIMNVHTASSRLSRLPG